MKPTESTHKPPQTESHWWWGWKIYLILSGCSIGLGTMGIILQPSIGILGYGMWYLSRLLMIPIILRSLWALIHSWQQWTVTPLQSKVLTWIYRSGFGITLTGFIGHIILVIEYYNEHPLGMGALIFMIPFWIYCLGFPLMIVPLIVGKSNDLNIKRRNAFIVLILAIGLYAYTIEHFSL